MLFTALAHGQNIQTLYENIPMPYASVEECFQTAELEWEQETLDNGSLFNRAKSWAPGGAIKKYSMQLDRLATYIEQTSENNSFSLTAPAEIDKQTLKSIEELGQIRQTISNAWNAHRDAVTSINAEFVVPNELDNSCEQIEAAMNQLQKTSGLLQEKLRQFRDPVSPSLDQFQKMFDFLMQNRNPMVSNQVLDELSNLMVILNEIANLMNFHYKNMVETRMAWNNALCNKS